MEQNKSTSMIEFVSDYGYFIFDPRGCEDNYREQYPELAEYEEFRNLSSRELVWVWCVSNPTSPFLRLDTQERCKEAAIWCFGHESKWASKVNQNTIKKMSSGALDDKVSLAVDRMSKFSFTARKIADEMVMNMFRDLQDIMTLSPSDFKDAADKVNYTAFIGSRKQVRQELTELLPIVEKGFGIKKAGKTIELSDIDGQSVHEKFHKNELNNYGEE